MSPGLKVDKERSVPVKMGDGTVVYSEGIARAELKMGNHAFQQSLLVLNTNAFDLVLGMDFLGHPNVNGILFKPARLVVENDFIPLIEDKAQVFTLFRLFNTESYQLLGHLVNFKSDILILAPSTLVTRVPH